MPGTRALSRAALLPRLQLFVGLYPDGTPPCCFVTNLINIALDVAVKLKF